jgi:maltokinase
VRYPVDEVLDRTRGRLAAARPFAVGLPGAARAAAADALDAELDSVEAELAGPRAGLPAAGPCHGDLHLSHLIHRPGDTPGGPWRMTVIDLSTPALDPGDPAWAAQSPLEDTVAVRRALEYFTADEAAFEAARLLGIDQLDAMRGALDGAPGLPPDQRALLRGVFAVADAWRDRVLGLLLGPPDRTPLGRLLYVRRLLHELDYNCAHDRPYHAAIDLRHALDGRSTARLPAHPAGPAAASVSASASASANSPARKRP